jgi:hypothetical protein
VTTGKWSDIRRERRRRRNFRADMGAKLHAGDPAITPAEYAEIVALGDQITDPSTAAQKGESVVFVARILHDGAPTGTLFQVGSGNAGITVNFDGAGAIQLLAKSGGGAANEIDVTVADNDPPQDSSSLLADGYHTYVLALEKDSGKPLTQIHFWFDGVYVDTGAADSDAGSGDWTNAADWFYGDQGPVAVNGDANGGTLTNVGLVDPLQIFFGRLPAPSVSNA